MSITEFLYSLLRRLREVKPVSRKIRYGRIYLPKELIGEKILYLTVNEVNMLTREFERLEATRMFIQYILNTKNGTKMFNIVTRTWNPVTGCLHNCIYCWARRLALTKLRNNRKYRDGFIPKIHETEFSIEFDGGIVFVSDMGDLFGDFVPREWIFKVIEHVKKFPNTMFLFLTKNPKRYTEFLDYFPKNIILGATIETNRDDLYLEYKISNAPPPSLRYKAMKEVNWNLKFISIEPILDFDIDIFIEWIRNINPSIVYIGYDNYNNKLPEPPLNKTLELINKLSMYTLVIKKTIRKAWYET